MSDMHPATTVLGRMHQYGIWRLIAWGEGGVALLDGASFFVRGNAVATGPSYYVLRTIPWGMHTHGLVMLALGAYIYYSSARKDGLAVRVQWATSIYSVFISIAVIVSWIEAHATSFGAVTKWFFIAWCALSLALTGKAEAQRAPTPRE